MIVFGSHPAKENTKAVIKRLRRTAEEIYETSYDHNKIVKLLIDYGEFETAIEDRIIPSVNIKLHKRLRDAAKLTGDIFRKSIRKDFEVITVNRSFLNLLTEIESSDLPESITLKVPEGYAYYGLYPEMYFEAAEQFYRKYKPEKCIVIGIRSIGTSLSSVIWSALQDFGADVLSFTIRPYGDPFDRKVSFDKHHYEVVISNSNSYFLLVDEGPGLSGSSFATAAEELISSGIPREKIIYFPSRTSSGDDLISEKAQYYWKAVDKYHVSFEEYWINSGRFKQLTAGFQYEEISAGKWRNVLLNDKSKYPPVFEQFERRKYLLRDESNHIRYFIKFGGLGKYGERVFKNSLKFADAGFSPEVYKYDQGFIFYKYIDKANGDAFDIQKLMKFVMNYLLFIKREFPAEPSYTYEEMKEMIYTNTRELFNDAFVNKLMNIQFDKNMFSSAVMNDGRMFPHEWIFNDRYIKTDNTEHHFDHLYPGRQDIGWDIAAFFTEFNLSQEQRKNFIERFSYISKDNHLKKKLNFILIEYLAFRLGYSVFAAKNSSSEADKLRFSSLVKNYSDKLHEEVSLQT